MKDVEKLLIECGAKVSNYGFGYIIEAYDAIKSLLSEGEEWSAQRLYGAIAQKHGCSSHSVEGAIRKAIESIYNDPEAMPDFLLPEKMSGKLTNREFLCRLVRYIP